MRLNKKGGAALLLEVILSVIIFFILVVIIFGFISPNIKLKAHAHILSTEDVMSCNSALLNFVRAQKDGITYSDELINAYMLEDYSQFSEDVSEIFDSVFGKGNWTLAASGPANTSLFVFGEYTNPRPQTNCTIIIPLPAGVIQKECVYTENVEVGDGESAGFITPDGKINCTIRNADASGGDVLSGFGVERSYECPVQAIKAKSLYEETVFEEEESTLLTDTNLTDVATFEIPIGNRTYEIFIMETEDDINVSDAPVSVTLSRRESTEDCAIKLTLGVPGMKRFTSYEEWKAACESGEIDCRAD